MTGKPRRIGTSTNVGERNPKVPLECALYNGHLRIAGLAGFLAVCDDIRMGSIFDSVYLANAAKPFAAGSMERTSGGAGEERAELVLSVAHFGKHDTIARILGQAFYALVVLEYERYG